MSVKFAVYCLNESLKRFCAFAPSFAAPVTRGAECYIFPILAKSSRFTMIVITARDDASMNFAYQVSAYWTIIIQIRYPTICVNSSTRLLLGSR